MPARPLAAERAYLRITRDDAMTEAVRELDQRITAPRPVYASPVQVGELQKFTDPYSEGRISFVKRLVGGSEIIVIIPSRGDTRESYRAIVEMVDTVVAEMEPG